MKLCLTVVFRGGNHINILLGQEAIKHCLDKFLSESKEIIDLHTTAFSMKDVVAMYYGPPQINPELKIAQEQLELQKKIISNIEKQTGDGDEWKSN